ncbi:MAG: NADP-dependent oxidoreductase [Deltaproteobacteria bacterium]|nr:NADP-dependent oxidoreductase [Deltaproteobacteria bacterium]
MSEVNRQWLLRRRPVGMVQESDFELRETPLPKPGPGEVLVKNLFLAFEPAMRGWMEDRPSYLPPVGIGEVMRGVTAGQVVESNLAGLEPGDLVSGFAGWQEWCIGDANVTKLPAGATPEFALSILGVTGMTAYFGLLDVGEPQAGETLVVSGAAGATGSVVGQIGKIEGLRVIGLAGGKRKCAWLTEELGFDGAIDYKHENIGERLSQLCPDGVDVFFDNTGGEVLDEVLARINLNARIVLCGGIARYNEEQPLPGPANYLNLTRQRGRMQGFIVLDYLARFDEAAAKLTAWCGEGKIRWKVDVQEGFENAPRTFKRLFTGENFGKQLLRIATPTSP